MKKSFLLLSLVLLLGTSVSAQPNYVWQPGPMMRPMHNNFVPPQPIIYHYNVVHRHGCPIFRGHRCTCHRYYSGSGIHIDFRLPIVF